jgi:hypothetical protein
MLVRSRSALALVVLSACRPTAPVASAQPSRTHTIAVGASLDDHLSMPSDLPTRVARAQSPSELCAGPNAVGKLGDWVLDNHIVRAVIDDVRTGGGGFSLSGGQLVDLSRVDRDRAAPDELGQVFNYLGRFPRQLRYTDSTSETYPDGSAAVIVRGEDPRTPGLSGVTKYILRPGHCAIDLETTLTYSGQTPSEVGLGDAIQWAGAEHWAPGVGHALRGERRGPWLAGIGRSAVYAIVAENSAELFGPNGSAWSNPVQRTLTMSAGQSVTYRRSFGVSNASAVGDALRCAGFAPAGTRFQVRVRARTTDGALFAGMRAELIDDAGAPVWMDVTGADGLAVLSAPRAGQWRVRVSAVGRSASTPRGDVVVVGAADGGVAPTESPVIEADVSAPSTVRITVRDESGPTDARVLIYGINGTPDPMLGAVGRGDGARNSVLVSHREPRALQLPAGMYRVVATKGGFYSLGEEQFSLRVDAELDLALTVRRVVDAERRWVCGDFHTHQAPSLDSPVSTRDRVLAAAAEGLDVLAATDHNVATDLSAAVNDEDLNRVLATMGGDEVSTDVAVNPTGHWNIFPLRVDPARPLNGAPDLFELAADALVQRVRRDSPEAVLQLNHPRSGSPTGMFDIYGLDNRTGRANRPGFSSAFDALEVWNGRYQRPVDDILKDWLSLLRNGARITGAANSDSHVIVTQEVGYPRTCFRGALTWRNVGGPPGPSAEEQVREAFRVKRDVLMTDGPLLEVLRADGATSAVGASFVPGPRGERLHIRGVSASWAAADVLEMIRADGSIVPVAGAEVTRDRDVVRVHAHVRVRRSDSIVLFRLRGTQPIPVLVGDPPMMPMAISNPVYLSGNADTSRPPAAHRARPSAR